MDQITKIRNKIAGYWPSWVTKTGMNEARNTALAVMFADIANVLDAFRNNHHIGGAVGEQAFAVGVHGHPRAITGVRFFRIAASTLITNGVVSTEREYVLRHYVDGQTHRLGFEGDEPVAITRDGELYRLMGGKVTMLIDISRLPAVNLSEKVEFIPIYDCDYLARQGSLRNIRRWRGETDAQYRGRMIATIARGRVSLPAIQAAINEYCDYHGITGHVLDYREHYQSWYIVGRSCVCDYPGYRKYYKSWSDNVGFLNVVIKHNMESARIQADVENIMNRIIPQGCRYEVVA